jgi:hypothetical protein
MDVVTTERQLASLAPFLQKDGVAQTLERFKPVPSGSLSSFTKLETTAKQFFSNLENAYLSLLSTNDDPGATDFVKTPVAFAIFSGLAADVVTKLDEVSSTLKTLNTDLEKRSKPRPPSDDPATSAALLANARQDISMALPPGENFIINLEALFENSVANGRYEIAYLLADPSFSEMLVNARASNARDYYRSELVPRFIRSLATEKTLGYLEALNRLPELQNLPVLMSHSWRMWQDVLPATVKASIRRGGA